jgi:hypothetical protein
MQVIVDGEVRFIGRVEAGQQLAFQGESLIELRTGNAAALRVSYNGGDLRALGEQDQVLVRLWDAEGPMTPTPTISPTATATTLATPSYTPSMTPLTTGTETAEPEG